MLDVCFAQEQKKRPHAPWPELVAGLWANPAQAVERSPVLHRPPTLTGTTIIYSYEKDLALTGDDHLRILGWGKRMAPSELFSEADRRSLAGDGFSVPIAASLCFAYYMNPFAPWWPQPRHPVAPPPAPRHR